MIINLPILVLQNPAETFRRVVPKVRVGKTVFHVLLLMLSSFYDFLVQYMLFVYDHTELFLLSQQEVLHVAGADMQLAAAGSFLTVLQDDIVLIQTHTHSILQIVLLNLDHRDTGYHFLRKLVEHLYTINVTSPYYLQSCE